MSDCAMIRDDLKAYVDNELSAARRLVVRIHLARCGSCRKELAMLVRIADELRSRDTGTLDAALRYRILAEAVEVTSQQRQASRPRQLWRPRSLPAWSAVAAALAIVAVCYPLVDRDLERVLSGGFAPTAATKVEHAGSTKMAGVATMSRGGGATPQAKGMPLAAPGAPVAARVSAGTGSGAAAVPTAAEQSRGAAGGPVASNSLVAPPRGPSAEVLGYSADGHAGALRAAPAPALPGGEGVPTPSRGLDAAIVNGVAKGASAPMGRAGGRVELVARPSGPGDAMTNTAPALADALSASTTAVPRLSMELGVDAVEAKAVAVAQIVRDVNGAVDDQRLYKAVGAAPNAVIEMRVPTERADEVMKKLRKLGDVLPAGQAAGWAYGNQGTQNYAGGGGAGRGQAAPGTGQAGMGGGFGGYGGGQGGLAGQGGQGARGSQSYSLEPADAGVGGQALSQAQAVQLHQQMAGQQGMKGDLGQQAPPPGARRSVAQGRGTRAGGQAQEEARKPAPETKGGQGGDYSQVPRSMPKIAGGANVGLRADRSQQASPGQGLDKKTTGTFGGQGRFAQSARKDPTAAEKSKTLAQSGAGLGRVGYSLAPQQAGGQTLITLWLRQRSAPAAAAKPGAPAQRR